MILVVDSSALALLINPDAYPPEDPSTKTPVSLPKERVEYLISSMTASDTLIVPTPVLAELLVSAGDSAPDIIAQINGLARVRVKSFDERAAIEVALMTREAIKAGDKRGGSTEPWQKVKFDRQIIAIARVSQATKIYSDDEGLVKFARTIGVDTISTWDLPIPDSAHNLFTSSGLKSDGQSMD